MRVLGVGVVLAGLLAAAWGADEYEIAGPLQGVKLPLFPTQHGERPGYPGVMKELQQPDAKGNVPFTTEGLPPERELYAGSVEHYRAYWMKYLPVKSFFDRQSLLKNWLAPELAGGKVEEYAAPVYWVPRHAEPQPTGKTDPPVKVLRCKVQDPVLTLDLGNLPVGLYALRVIGAVETKALERHRRPLILKLTVNDGLQGEESTYRFRCKYVDEFYAVAEFYFHAPVARGYRATLTVDQGSLVELLVHNVDLHDALAGTIRRPLKTRATLNPPLADPKLLPNDPPLLARDAGLWNAFPPLNLTFGFIYGMGGDDPKSNWPNFGAGGQTPEQIAEQWGIWNPAPLGEVLLTNAKLKLEYRVEDLAAGRPLPDPYLYKDYGQGVYTPPAAAGQPGQNLIPVAMGVQNRLSQYVGTITAKAQNYRAKNDPAEGRDAALMLCRLAYAFPALDSSNAMSSILVQPGAYGRDLGCRRRDPKGFIIDVEFLDAYDRLFDLLKADAGLATSVQRFVPWVKTPADVIQLLDVYLVQTLAKRYLRYNYYFDNEPAKIVTPAIVIGDPRITDPWMDWLFSSTFIYPLPPSGLQDLLVTGNDRDGIGYIASYFYAMGEQSAPKVGALERYVNAGGNPKYDLRDPARFPKPIAACYWFLQTRIAGLYFPRVGDVTGPDKNYAAWFDNMPSQCRLGWRWTKDQRFAFVIKNYGGRRDETDAEWSEIEQAAAKQPRAPWLECRSRVVPNWFGLLETGVESDDLRFRRNVLLRIGQGWGHSHADTLDLQMHAHGYPMTTDGGQRGGYSSPGDATTRVHNLVEVDGANWQGHAWISALSDAAGARYLAAQAEPPKNHPNVSLYRRQVALVDADDGQVVTPGPVPDVGKQGPWAKVVTPNAYVVDVVRVAGGKLHTYCFHGPIEDELATNMENRVTADALTPDDHTYLDRFPRPEFKSAGTAPAEVVATWRFSRGINTRPGFGDEATVCSLIWDPQSPRKYTRLHVLGHAGARVMTAALNCHQWGYSFSNLYVQERQAAEGAAVFPAVIEPYLGEPFITSTQLLDIADNDTDAQRAVAIAVKTRNGHDDLCFADGRPEKTRTVGALQIAGEFALYGRDAQGFRQATLTGGTLLAGPEVTIRPVRAERGGLVTKVDYPARTLVIDQAWPDAPLLRERALEVGVPGHLTTYTVAAATAAAKTTQLVVTEGADFYVSRVLEVLPETQTIRCALAIPHTEKVPCPGVNQHWVAANEDGTKFWRAEYQGLLPDTTGYSFKLDGPVAEADFGRAHGFRLWEYGVGDTVRQSTFVAVRRLDANVYEVTGDVAAEVALPGKAAAWSADRATWAPAAAKAEGGRVTVAITPALLAKGVVYLRVEP